MCTLRGPRHTIRHRESCNEAHLHLHALKHAPDPRHCDKLSPTALWVAEQTEGGRMAFKSEQRLDGSAVLLHQVHHSADLHHEWTDADRRATSDREVVQEDDVREKGQGSTAFGTILRRLSIRFGLQPELLPGHLPELPLVQQHRPDHPDVCSSLFLHQIHNRQVQLGICLLQEIWQWRQDQRGREELYRVQFVFLHFGNGIVLRSQVLSD